MRSVFLRQFGIIGIQQRVARAERRRPARRFQLELVTDHHSAAMSTVFIVERLVDHGAIAATVRIPQLGNRLTEVDLDSTIVNQRLKYSESREIRGVKWKSVNSYIVHFEICAFAVFDAFKLDECKTQTIARLPVSNDLINNRSSEITRKIK